MMTVYHIKLFNPREDLTVQNAPAPYHYARYDTGVVLSDRFYYLKHDLCACSESLAEFVAVNDML